MIADLVIIGLAVYRMSRLLTREYGPGCCLEYMRHRLGVRRNEHGRQTARPGSLGDLASCPMCLGLWLSVIIATAYYHGGSCGQVITMAIAAAGLSVIIFRVTGE